MAGFTKSMALLGVTLMGIAPVVASAQEASEDGGAYGGIAGGFAAADNRLNDADGFVNLVPGEVFDFDNDGTALAAIMGYDFAVGDAVLGVESDVTLGSVASSSLVDIDERDETISSEYDVIASMRAKLGYKSGAVTIFATGGLAFARLDQRMVDFDGVAVDQFDADDSFSERISDWGRAFSAGLQADVGDGWAARVEFQHFDFGTNSYFVNYANDYAPVTGPVRYDLDTELIIARIGITKRL